MTERPILMSEPMVLAILDGSKTETRRIVKADVSPDVEFVEYYRGFWQAKRKSQEIEGLTLFCGEWRDRYGVPGDQLWVKETFRIFGGDEYAYQQIKNSVVYRAGAEVIDYVSGPWKPSIFMWRWASRINLKVKSTRVERLHDITDAGAIAEGVSGVDGARGEDDLAVGTLVHDRGYSWPKARYALLWNKINGRGSWEKNAWVTVIQFSKL